MKLPEGKWIGDELHDVQEDRLIVRILVFAIVFVGELYQNL